jgi:RsmE family RNA methyltransferase
VGDTIRVGIVGGGRGTATLTESTETGITLQVDWEDDHSESLPVTVLVGHPRPPVLQRLLRDLTALRVGEIHVFVGVLSEASYLGSSLWNKTDQVIRDGLSQGMHTAAPSLHRWKSLSAALDSMLTEQQVHPSATYRVFGALDPEARSLPGVLSEIERTGSIARVVVAIGPERGFTAEEKQLLMDHRFSGVHLGRSTLRTETATILLAGAACAALS